MASWEKLLQRMLDDRRPVSYTYADAVRILGRLGFVEGSKGTSHRTWRFRGVDGNTVVVGLVDAGHGTLKPVYIREMLRILRDNNLLPPPTSE